MYICCVHCVRFLEFCISRSSILLPPRQTWQSYRRHLEVGSHFSWRLVAQLALYGFLAEVFGSIPQEIKRRLKAGNSCYYSVQTLLSSRLLYKNMKIKIYKTIILPVVLYGCETWSLTLREESRLRVFENRILRRIFGPK